MCSFSRFATRLLALPPKALRRRYLSRGVLAAPFFFTILSSLLILFWWKICTIATTYSWKKKRLFRSITSCARAVLPLLLLLASGLSKLQPSTISSFSPRKKLRVRFENGKIFSDSRGNRQANWNLDNFLHLFTPCNLPTFGEVVTWKSWRLA